MGTIEGSDLDAPPNSDLSFYIESGNTNDMFNLTQNGNADQRVVTLYKDSERAKRSFRDNGVY